MITFDLRLRALTLLTIGWNIGEVLGCDVLNARKIVRGDFVIYIPGSSVKGALRSAASKIAEAYGFSCCGEINPDRIKESHKGGICDVCRLFGYPGMEFRSPLIVTDFMADKVQTVALTRVTINDKTNTAEEHKLYTMEHVLPGVEFKGTIKLMKKAKDLLPLLLLAIAELRTGRFGRRSVVDAKIEGEIDVDPEWKQLVNELKTWLWVDAVCY